MSRPRTPAVISFILRVILPRYERDRVIGDLVDDYSLYIVPCRNRFGAWMWFWREGLSLLAAYALARLRKDGSRDISVVLESRRFEWRSRHHEQQSRMKGNMMESFIYDVRFTFRTLIREPRYLITVVLTLAIGIGANTAIFSVLNGIVLKPLEYREPGRLVRIYTTPLSDPDQREYWCGLDFIDVREMSESFEALACYYDYRQMGFDMTGGDRPRRIFSMPVSSDYFEVLGFEPLLGRTITRDEERFDNNDILISHRLWQERFTGDMGALGESILLDGAPHRVIGVLPPGFREPTGKSLDVWLAQNLVPGGVPPGGRGSQNSRDNYYLSAVGRLHPGVTIDAAEAELAAIAAVIEQENPEANRDPWRVSVVPLNEVVIGGAGTMLTILLGAVALVLLIACVNVVNLSLARHTYRERELAIRTALGSSRRRLVRQMLTESVVAALLGGAAGLLFAWGGVKLLLAARPDALPRVEAITFDTTIFAFTAGVSVAVGIIFGLIPAFRFSRPDIERSLRETGRSTSTGLRHRRLRSTLVVSQVGLAVILLVGAGLLMQSFARLVRLDLGVETEKIITFDLSLPPSAYSVEEPARRIAFYRQFHERLEGLPGVRAAGAVSRLPVTGEYHRWSYLTRRDFDEAGSPLWNRLANIRIVRDHYFEAMGIELLSGRLFKEDDGPESPPVTIINRTLANDSFPDSDAIGQQIWRDGWREIVGVVEDVRVGYREETPEKLYMPYNQYATNRAWIMAHVVATDSDITGLTDAVRSELAALDPNLVMFNIETMDRVAGRAIARDRFAMFLMMAFAGVALLLAMVGIYGVLSYTVSQRTYEIGIRMALGAQHRDVHRAVVREGMAMAIVGIVVGMAVALATARLLESLVYEISVTDPSTLAGGAILLGLVAWLTCFIPARRATRTDPIEIMRAE